ncbi:DDT domain-containing protein PTM-like isoform X1 [Hordeum vulgare subsp. vulgare]|uniref:Uncharacterized protein n=1 Tax=Hordeum vulgare subsp. vulgare TaxID=112509 RepID=M0WU28_HORVV|nr:DDT domain-containing protein PTM-like isoform X1 [Hordeum vulgare subsp. vulgare]XP_044949108.1 DDT domain-containing protein PTM-like isoform X1 [Hordeum vulgare subsp. vulgare]
MDPAAAQPREAADRMPAEDPPAVAPSAAPLADELMEEIAEASPAVGEEETPAVPPVAGTSEAKVEEKGGGATTEQETIVLALALVSEGKMDVDDCCTGDAHHAAAPVATETKTVVHDTTIPEQEHALATEVKMEQEDQQPTQPAGARQVKEEEGECLVGRYISQTADDGTRIRLGKVASYDTSIGAYSVVFENGRSEELGHPQLQELLMTEENGASGMKVSCRKRKLDLVVSSGTATALNGPPTTRQKVDACEMPDASQQSGSDSDVSEDVESSSNSSDSTKDLAVVPCLPVQAPELPPSSGDIDVPGDSISHLFSVYNFLRSFSVQLFLSPFGMDDFVASINCSVQSTLFDAVHVSLLRALRRQLETKSSEGSELASNCLKYLDWSLLDALTWPTLLLEYLYVMRCIKSLGGKSFGRSLLALEYYKLPVTMKLRVLQILSDHAIDSEELKTELEAREAYNEELEYEMDPSNSSEAGSRVVLTRPSRVSACKKIEDSQTPEAAPNATSPEAIVANASLDGNSDDCRICGMDGTLVCCDGCPWAYHSRCIGLNKAFLPQGLWFCPECVVNKLGPTSSRIERGARGAQMFGIDMCGRLFLGSCNYLLVTGTSSNAESYASYYNQYDVVKIIQVLARSDAYTAICRRITEYWPHLLDVFQNERSKIGKNTDASYALKCNMSQSASPREAVDGSVRSILKDGGESKAAVFSQVDVQHKFVANQFTVCSADQLEEQKCMVTSVDDDTENNNLQTSLAQNDIHITPINGAFGSSGLSSVSHQNGSMVAGLSNITHAQPAYPLIRTDLSVSFSGMKDNAMSREDIGSAISVKADSSSASQNKHPFGNVIGGKAAKLSSFKPLAYMNLYNHGNIAASAAANLAVLTSDEGKVAASQVFTNPRKKMAADCALQVKAFSSAAAQFVWPCTEKKVMEVPRDRCGWCLACKSSAIGNKKACFLNLATANASKGSARIFSTMHVIKSSESHFPSIVAYLTNMEESLRGLLAGSLQDMQQRQRWHQQLQEASNCRTIIPLLLELESNIRGIVFSASWLKLMDDWPVKSPGVSAGPSRSAAYQKRGTGGRRGRKRLLASESSTVTDDDKSWKEVNWWNGGNISKCILQRGVLPSSSVRKAARQGGKRKIAGLSYHEASNFPRRTRQFAWRACVGLSHNSSQLALQVRYLDTHIKWKEFIPPDQIPSDGKISDADHSALRNAVVCDRKVVDGNIRYALKFSNQKHLPVRVTKNILEAEDNQDENGKLWFSESHVPLYLVRDFEQKAGVSSSPSPGMIISNSFTNFYQRRVKATIGDIFFYLFHKGDVYACSSCEKDVAFRDAVKCSSCQGNCHKECTSGSVGSKGGNTAPNLMCKLCLQKHNLIQKKTNANSALSQQKSNGQLSVTAPKIIFTVRSAHSSEPAMNVAAKIEAQPVAKVESQPTKVETQTIMKVETQPIPKAGSVPRTNVATQNIARVQVQPKAKTKKPKPEKPKKPKKVQVITYFGLVWKKNKNDISGEDFRVNDIILKSKDGIGSSIQPACCLCNKPYSPDFMYVRCERCQKWFHGDALQLEEERITEVVQYRCCRCRRRAIPQCPHSDDYREPEPEVSEQTATMSSQSTMLSGEETFAIADQDPLLASYGIVEPIGEESMNADLSINMGSLMPGNNQKLSIRRAQVKNSEYLDQAGTSVNGYYVQNQPPGEANINFGHMTEFSMSEADGVDASELLGWDFTQGNGYAAGPDHGTNSQWNDTSGGSIVAEEYEPQTYFSFTELLEADDTQFDNTFGMSTGLQDDGNFAGSFDQQGASFDELTFMVEEESSNVHFPATDPSIDELVCHKCKDPQPPPDLKCSSCGLCVHHQCSPWQESEQPGDSANWRCGTCREWQ